MGFAITINNVGDSNEIECIALLGIKGSRGGDTDNVLKIYIS